MKNEILEPNDGDVDALFEANFDENEDVINCDCEDCLEGGDGHHQSTAAPNGNDYRYDTETVGHQVNYDDADYDNEDDEQVDAMNRTNRDHLGRG